MMNLLNHKCFGNGIFTQKKYPPIGSECEYCIVLYKCIEKSIKEVN